MSRDEFRTELTLRIGNNIALAFSDARVDTPDADPGDPRGISWPSTTAINNAMTVGRTVRVRITGPDHAPEMPAHRQVAQVDENSGGGVVVRRVEDTGVSGGTPPYQFSLEGADASRYDIDANTGNIITRAGVTYDHESTPECYNSAGFVGRCHKLTLRATSAGSGTTRLSATRPLWVRVMDKFEWEGHAAQEPGVVRLEWDSPGGAFFKEICPVAGFDLLYWPRDETLYTNDLVNGPWHGAGSRSFSPGTTRTELRGLHPDHEYSVWMRERHPERAPGSGCPWSGPLPWLKGTVRTTGHGDTGTVPRISLVIPDLLDEDDINLPGSASLDVGEGTTQKMRVLVDLPSADHFPEADDGFALRLEYTWANGSPPGSTSLSEPAVLRRVAQRHGKRWVMDYRVDIPDGSVGNGPLDIDMSVLHVTRNGERVRSSGFGRGFAAGGTRVRFDVCTGVLRLRSAAVPADGGNLVLTYDEDLDTTAAGRPEADMFAVKVNGRDLNPTTVSVSGRTVTLSGFPRSIRENEAVTVSYADEGGCLVDDTRAIQSDSGADALAFTDVAVTNNSTLENRPPRVTLAGLDGVGFMDLTFSESLSSRGPPISAFRLSSDGDGSFLASIERPIIEGRDLSVGVAGDYPALFDRIRVEYRDPTPGDDEDAIQNEHGLDAASFCIEFTVTATEHAFQVPPSICTLSSGQDGGSEPEPAPGPLTASWSPPPPLTHNGTAFTVGLEFSEAVSASAEEVRGAVSATGATVTGAALADGSDRLWNLAVTPSGTDGVSLFLAATNDCADAGAICTAGGKALSGGLAHAMLFAPWLSVDDAEATEGADATMDFTVTLAPAAGGTVTVGYATSDGTATEPADYASTTGTLTFTAGQTTKTVSVPIVDDDTPDSGETFTLTLGNVGGTEIVDVVDATATGTILNHEAPAGPLTGFTLVDASTNADVGTIADGATFTLPAPANGSYGIRAETSGNAEFGSVKLALSGARAVTQTESVAPWSLHGDDGTNVAGAGLPAGSYTLTATAHAEAGGRGEALQTLAVSFTVAAAPPLAGFTLVNASTNTDVGTIADGATFTLSDPANGSYGVRVETSGNAEFGSVKLALSGAKAVTQTESVAPWSLYGDDGTNVAGAGLPAGSYTLTATAHAEAGGQGAALQTLAVSFTVVEPLSLSVQDATAAEATDTTVDFTVTLSRASAETVTVDYTTSDGTATSDEDYTETSGTLTFAADDLSKTIAVPILDDALNEGNETFTLTLSNASGARVADGEATGTIENSDPLQTMWLSRYGRTVADQVTTAVSDRLASPLSGAQVTVGGQTVDLAETGDEAWLGRTLTSLAHLFGATAGPAPGDDPDGSGTDGWPGTGLGPLEPPARAGSPARLPEGRELLLGSAFHLAAEGDGTGPGLAAWGRVTAGGFDGEAPADAGGVRVDGDVTTGILGADATWSRLLAGVAVSVSEGKGSFAQPGVDSGKVESTMTTVSPYARLGLSDRLSVWGLSGFGNGDMTIVQAANESGQPERVTRTDLEMRLAALGARGALMEAGEAGGLDLALKADAFHVETESEPVSNEGATTAVASRVRLALEGSRAFGTQGGGVLTPGLELGLRHDGGDAETGTGVELGGRLAWTDPGTGLSVEASVRTLIAHEDSEYGEWGASGSVRLGPGERGRGLSLSLRPTWGAASSGVGRLWSARDARGLAPGEEFEAERRLEGEAGYGMSLLGDRITGTPNLGFGLSGTARDYRIGWRLTSAVRGGPGLRGQSRGHAPRGGQRQRAGRARGHAAQARSGGRARAARAAAQGPARHHAGSAGAVVRPGTPGLRRGGVVALPSPSAARGRCPPPPGVRGRRGRQARVTFHSTLPTTWTSSAVRRRFGPVQGLGAGRVSWRSVEAWRDTPNAPFGTPASLPASRWTRAAFAPSDQAPPDSANPRPRRAAVRSRSALSRMKPSASFWSYAPRSSSNVAIAGSNRSSVSELRPTTSTLPL